MGENMKPPARLGRDGKRLWRELDAEFDISTLVPHTESWVNVKPAVAAFTPLNVAQTSPGPTVRDFTPMAEVES